MPVYTGSGALMGYSSRFVMGSKGLEAVMDKKDTEEAPKKHRLFGISDISVSCICGWEFTDESIESYESWDILTAKYEDHR